MLTFILVALAALIAGVTFGVCWGLYYLYKFCMALVGIRR